MVTQGANFAEYAVATAACILGAGSLALFGLFLWAGSFGFVEIRLSQGAELIWDGGLCLLFFAQHSCMVRKRFRQWAGRILPAHCDRIVYTTASGAALLLLVVYWQPSAIRIFTLEGAAQLLTKGVLLLCLAGILWGIRSLEAFDAFGAQAYLAHFREARPPQARLTIAGPYRMVRHPFYSFGMVALWATPVLTLDRLVLNSLFTAWIVLGAHLEERDLREEFGEEYKHYQLSVPMFVPRRRPSVRVRPVCI